MLVQKLDNVKMMKMVSRKIEKSMIVVKVSFVSLEQGMQPRITAF